MIMDDRKINSIIHSLTNVTKELQEISLNKLALKIECIREEILMAIQEDKEGETNVRNN